MAMRKAGIFDIFDCISKSPICAKRILFVTCIPEILVDGRLLPIPAQLKLSGRLIFGFDEADDRD